MKHIEFPSINEYPAYAEMYMQLVNKKDKNLLEQLVKSLEQTKKLVSSLSKEKLDFKYQEDKWSIKEVLVHIVDDERIYAYRALTFARNDRTELPGFEQNDYALNSDASKRDINNIMEEYEAVRKATISLFNGFSKEALIRKGRANENIASVRAIGYHILGHELHHMQIIEDVYLK